MGNRTANFILTRIGNSIGNCEDAWVMRRQLRHSIVPWLKRLGPPLSKIPGFCRYRRRRLPGWRFLSVCSPGWWLFIPTRCKLGATAWSSRRAGTAGCCCLRCLRKMIGTARLSWNKLAARLGCRRMPGAKAPALRRSRPRSSLTLTSLMLTSGSKWSDGRPRPSTTATAIDCFPSISASVTAINTHSCAPQPHFRTLVFPVERRNLSPAAFRWRRRRREGNMELAVVIVVVMVAGAMIPGNPKIRFFR
jgi:hypothetical protein